jgi:hypothetical protein
VAASSTYKQLDYFIQISRVLRKTTDNSYDVVACRKLRKSSVDLATLVFPDGHLVLKEHPLPEEGGVCE